MRRARARRRRRGRMGALPGAAPRPTPPPVRKRCDGAPAACAARRRPRRSGGRPDRGHRVLRPGAPRRGVGRRRRDRRALRPRLPVAVAATPSRGDRRRRRRGAARGRPRRARSRRTAALAERATCSPTPARTTWFGEQPRDVRCRPPRGPLAARRARGPPRPPATEPALILYTSGTTGLAQGRGALARRDGRRPRRARRGVGVDRRRHPRPRPAAVPRARPGARGVRRAAHRRRGWCTPAGRRPANYARAVASTARRCCSGCRRCGRGSPSDPDAAPPRCADARLLVSGSAPLPGAGVRARPRSSPGRRRWSATA